MTTMGLCSDQIMRLFVNEVSQTLALDSAVLDGALLDACSRMFTNLGVGPYLTNVKRTDPIQ